MQSLRKILREENDGNDNCALKKINRELELLYFLAVQHDFENVECINNVLKNCSAHLIAEENVTANRNGDHFENSTSVMRNEITDADFDFARKLDNEKLLTRKLIADAISRLNLSYSIFPYLEKSLGITAKEQLIVSDQLINELRLLQAVAEELELPTPNYFKAAKQLWPDCLVDHVIFYVNGNCYLECKTSVTGCYLCCVREDLRTCKKYLFADVVKLELYKHLDSVAKQFRVDLPKLMTLMQRMIDDDGDRSSSEDSGCVVIPSSWHCSLPYYKKETVYAHLYKIEDYFCRNRTALTDDGKCSLVEMFPVLCPAATYRHVLINDSSHLAYVRYNGRTFIYISDDLHVAEQTAISRCMRYVFFDYNRIINGRLSCFPKTLEFAVNKLRLPVQVKKVANDADVTSFPAGSSIKRCLSNGGSENNNVEMMRCNKKHRHLLDNDDIDATKGNDSESTRADYIQERKGEDELETTNELTSLPENDVTAAVAAVTESTNHLTDVELLQIVNTLPSDIISGLVLKKYIELCKVSNLSYTSVKAIAGVLMVQNGDYANGTVVNVCTGNNIIDKRYLSNDGDVLLDMHAEILARRALLHYFYSQLELLKNTDAIESESIFEHVDGTFRLKNGITFHLYISVAPCGDGRIFTVTDKSFINAETVGQLRMKVKSHDADANSFSSDDSKRWSDQFVSEEFFYTMCCSDKLLVRNVLGLQGGILSNVISPPIYYSSITIGDYFNFEHLQRALYDRVDASLFSNDCSLRQYHYSVHKPVLYNTRNRLLASCNKGPKFSFNWIIGESIETVNSNTGKVIDDTPSRLSKLSFFNKFSKFVQCNNNQSLSSSSSSSCSSSSSNSCSCSYNCSCSSSSSSSTSSGTSATPINYSSCKVSANPYRKIKLNLYEYFQKNQLGHWLSYHHCYGR